MNTEIPNLNFWGEKSATAWSSIYGDGSLAIGLDVANTGEQLAMISVNLSEYGHTPAPGCIFVKSYSENAGLLERLIALGLVEVTGRKVRAGFVSGVAEARLTGALAPLADLSKAL